MKFTKTRIDSMTRAELVSHLMSYYFKFGIVRQVTTVCAVYELPIRELRNDLYEVSI